MSWTVIVESETGIPKKQLPYEFELSSPRILYNDEYKVLRYLDPYGDTTFNCLMFADLATDLMRLRKQLPVDDPQIADVLQLVRYCQQQGHTYLKFYGD